LTILHFDCFSGAAGDMILGALLDAGLSLDDLRGALGSLAIDRDVVWTERVTRAGIRATKFHVRGEEAPGEHTGHHGHRHLCEVERLIDGSALSAVGKDRAKTLFRRLAEVEAAVHGTSIEKVHFHEVGALDSIVDVVGTVYALEALGVSRVTASPLNVGTGSVATSHGLYPVPAPATTRLLEGVPVYSGRQQGELVTPTGALLISAYAETYGGTPSMRLQRAGYGAGSRDFSEAPNVLRVLIGESAGQALVETVSVIETEIDDMNPQIFGLLIEQLIGAGALDVFYTPIQMKKNRPGILLSIIAPPQSRERLTSILFRESTTIGVRHTDMQRECLERETVTVATPFGPVRVKVARRNGEVLNAAPEFDDCARVAAERGRPVKEVHAAAMKAFLDLSSEPLRPEA
jgi:pyridinium-3,5-bisthiocarboxylic acid mononucleotide nickel chelatase